MSARHLAPEKNTPSDAIHRALSRAKGRHGRRRMAGEWVGGEFVPAGDTAPALFGQYDPELDELTEVHLVLDAARGVSR